MKPFVRAQLERYAQRRSELDFLLSREDVMRDMDGFMKLSREHAEVSGVVERWHEFLQAEQDMASSADMLADPGLDEAMHDMAREELESAQGRADRLAAELQRTLLPKDPDDERPAYLEIRAGTGGDESALFAGDLLRMYTRHADNQGWRVELLSESPSELGGYKEAVLRISGERVYGRLKFGGDIGGD